MAGGCSRGQQVIASESEARRVVGRVIGHLRRVDADADGAAHVQPTAGGRGTVHVPPTVARFDSAVSRARHRIERPRLVRMPAVYRAQGRTLDLAQETALMVMRIAGRLSARCPGKVQLATVLRRG